MKTMRALALSAVFALALAPLSARAEIHYAGDVAWTIDMPGVSVATGVAAVDFRGMHFAQGNASWTSPTGVKVSTQAPWRGGVLLSGNEWNAGSLTPSGTTVKADTLFVNSGSNTSGPGQTVLSLGRDYSYFGGLLNTNPSATDLVQFYNDGSLVYSLDVTGLGAKVGPGGATWSAYLNVDFLNGAVYDTVVIAERDGARGQPNGISILGPMVSTSAVSLTDASSSVAPTGPGAAPAPLPALAGTLPGLLALALVRLRRRRAAA